MTGDVKAIETVYDGHRFRSRLEARWATFFNHLAIPYEYETEGFDLNGLWYLPDFWLPKQEYWIEVKGTSIEERDEAWEKAYRLAEAFEQSVYVFCGQFPNRVGSLTGLWFDPYTRSFPPERQGPPAAVWWFRCLKCQTFQPGMRMWDLPCGCLPTLPDDDVDVVAAVLAARQARFERGGSR